MATATILNPAPHYQPQHHPYSNYSHSATGSSMPGIISPVESRRAPEDNESHNRQSLPSIQEVIGAKPPTSAFPPSISTAVSRAPSLPSPFTSSSARPYQDLSAQDNKHHSPRSLHNPPTAFPARSEPMPPFADPARAPLSARPPAPPPPPAGNNYHPGPRPSPPPLKMETHMAERQPEPHRTNSYSHSAVSEPTSMPYPPQAVQLPPGQLPLSAHPMSPRYSTGPSLPSPFDGPRSSMHDEGDYMRRSENKYEQTLSRHFEAWQYQESLAKVCHLFWVLLVVLAADSRTDCVWFEDDLQLCRCLWAVCCRGARP